MHQPLTVITSNPHKLTWFRRYLPLPITYRSLDLPEIQSLSVTEVVTQKAQTAYNLVHGPVLVEDTSLIFTALGKLPGPFIKWFLTELGTPGLCRLLAGYDTRRATASVVFGFCDGKTVTTFRGEQQGTITDTPRGSNGFGWDAIFIPEGETKTYAEMTDTEQAACSIRQMALKELEAYFNQDN